MTRPIQLLVAGSCVTSLLIGCAVDPSGIPRREDDVSPADFGFIDGGARDLAVPDLGDRPDMPRPDAGPLDLGPPDMGPPDMGPPDMGPPPFCMPTTGLVGCYTFEGAAPFTDRSGSANHLVATNVATDAGAVGSAAWFDAGSSLYAPNSASLDPSSAFSAELFLWIDAFPAAGRSGVVDKDGQFGIFVYPGGTLRCLAGGGATAETTGLSPSQWMHVACSHDGATMRLYVNGAEVATATGGPLGAGTAALHLGEDSPGGGDQLAGRIDELRFWTRALPVPIIQASAGR